MRNFFRILVGLAFGAGLNTAFALPVIPGAQGFGIDTPAGRGGTVYRVTNLNDSGSGSLRACVAGSGARVCVFEVSGTIQLGSDLIIKNPYVTIAGQTAPSPGVTLRGGSLVVEDTHDVLIQHLRVRVGDDAGGPKPDNRDGFQIRASTSPTRNVVADHLSVSWAIDENIQLWYPGVSDVTIRNSISSEALRDSIHPKGVHSMGLIIGPDIKRVSVIGSLLTHNIERNPRLALGSETEFVNNVINNWGARGIDTEGHVNAIGNYFKSGSDTQSGNSCIYERASVNIYAHDNVGCGFRDATSPAVKASGYKPLSGAAAYDHVLANAGARPADRDDVDARVVEEVRSGNGRIIDSPRDVGGWPELAINRRALALPAAPNADDDGDGYTNLEEWLHDHARQVEAAGKTDDVPPAAPVLLEVN